MLRTLKWLLTLAFLITAAWYPLFLYSPAPDSSDSYALDIDKIRQLAEQARGPKPSQLRVEKVAEFVFTEAMTIAGGRWQATPMPVYSYKLEFPGRWLIIDAAVPDTIGIPGAFVSGFYPEALQRMYTAMEKAAGIYITHEHFDHIGGIVAHPKIADFLDRVHLTREQFEHPERMLPLRYPDGTFDNYKAMDYQGMKAIAPGVVLIKSAGHTPGSQMVFIKLSNGEEILLLGDVSWKMRNIDLVRERPMITAAFIMEDRGAVINQFQALNKLKAAEPDLHMVPGHDADVMQALLEKAVIRAGF